MVDASTLTDQLVGREPALLAVAEALGANAEQPLHAPELVWPETWGMRHALTAYDATSLAVAVGLDDPLLPTADGGLAAAAGAVLGTRRVMVTR